MIILQGLKSSGKAQSASALQSRQDENPQMENPVENPREKRFTADHTSAGLTEIKRK
jgi:hypothetical protein